MLQEVKFTSGVIHTEGSQVLRQEKVKTLILPLTKIARQRTAAFDTHTTSRLLFNTLFNYLLQGALGNPFAFESGPQLSHVDAPVFVDVQLVKQLSPKFLSLRVSTSRAAVLTEGLGEPGPQEPHVWSHTVS